MRRKKRRGIVFIKRRFFGALCSALLACILLLTTGFFHIRTLSISGTKQISVDAIKNFVPPNVHVLQIPYSRISRQLRAHPKVKDVQLKFRFPSRLEIWVSERKPLGLFLNGKRGFVVDEERMAMEETPAHQGFLPVLLGFLPFSEPRLGEAVSAPNLREALACLKWSHLIAPRRVAQVEVSKNAGLLFYTNDDLLVKMGKIPAGRIPDKMKTLAAVLNEMDKRSKPMKYVDLQVEEHPAVGLKTGKI